MNYLRWITLDEFLRWITLDEFLRWITLEFALDEFFFTLKILFDEVDRGARTWKKKNILSDTIYIFIF